MRRFFFRWLVGSLVLVCALPLAVLGGVSHAQPVDPASAPVVNQSSFQRLTQTLGNSGLPEPVVMAETGETRVFYLPVARNTMLSEQEVLFRARYLVGEESGGRLQLMVNGQPVFTRVYTGDSGKIDLKLPISKSESRRGFVELQVNWLSNRTLRTCEIEPASTNSLIIEPTTGIGYSVPDSVTLDLASAWQLLPADGVLAVSDATLSQAAFDAAWRVGTALELAGKQLNIQSLAPEGSRIEVSPVQIPDVLRGHTISERLTGQPESVVLEDAVFGGLLLLDPKSLLGDVVIADDALTTRLERTLAAFRSTLETPAQIGWFNDAISKTFLDSTFMADHNVMILGRGSSRVVVIKASAAENVAELFGLQWRNILNASAVEVSAAKAKPLSPSGVLKLDNLGANTRSMDVVNHAVWQTDFTFRSVDFNGRVPNELVLDVAASPDTSGARPVLSVSWNDILLTATQLQADGEAERISARIPSYAIGQSNQLKVMLQRLPSANGCTEPQVGFPFAVMPTSYVRTDKATPEPTFNGLMPMLANKANLVLPADWLANAPAHLSDVVRLASASGLSPQGAQLVLQAPDTEYEPNGLFVAMGVPVKSVSPAVSVNDDGRLVINGYESEQLNIGGLSDVSSIEVVHSGEYFGLYWNALPKVDKPDSGLKLVTPYELDRGDIAIVTSSGLVSWIDSTNPAGSTLTERAQSVFYEWRRFFSWGVPTIVGLLFLVLLLVALAYRSGRRNGTK